jgi:hypothetical protein
MTTTNQIPQILTANTYFWKPSTSASGRRSNENRRLSEVADFFKQLGFDVEMPDRVVANKAELRVIFTYSETCNNVYKTLAVYKNGKVSNITAIKKLIS